jgi:hypothetical protein
MNTIPPGNLFSGFCSRGYGSAVSRPTLSAVAYGVPSIKIDLNDGNQFRLLAYHFVV